MTSHASCRAEGSNPVVGSSRNSRSGSPAEGDGDVQPPLLPPGQLQHPGIALGLQADQFDHLVHRARMRVEPCVHRHRLRHGQVAIHPGGLQDDPDLALQALSLPRRVKAENLDRAVVAGPVTLEDLDGGGLPGAVRAEDGEDLPALDEQVDPPHRLHAAVRLGQTVHLDRGPTRLNRLSHGT